MSLVPTPVLIELLPLGGLQSDWGDELFERMGLGPAGGAQSAAMTPAQQLMLMRRIAHGNALARPISARWQRSFGALMTTRARQEEFSMTSVRLGNQGYMDGTPADESLMNALEEMAGIPGVVRVRTRDTWPAGMPVLIEMIVDHWWPGGCTDTVDVQWSANDGAASGHVSARRHAPLDVGLEGHVTMSLDITIQNLCIRIFGEEPGKRVVRDTNAVQSVIQYDTVASMDQVMAPLEGTEYDELIRTCVVASWEDNMLFLDQSRLRGTPIEGAAVAVKAEMLQDGVMRGWYEMRCIAGGPGFTMTSWHDADTGNWSEGGQWTVRLRTYPEWAVQVLDADRYWQGVVDLPLHVK
jgi:hypothetical protein